MTQASDSTISADDSIRIDVADECDAIDNDALRALRQEAGEHGDLGMVAICDRALGGDDEAVLECARVIAEARAHDDR